MSARSAAAIVSLALLGGSAGCTNFYEVPIETPIQAKLDVAAFRRVLVAGFISGGTDDVDANLETVRLLQASCAARPRCESSKPRCCHSSNSRTSRLRRAATAAFRRWPTCPGAHRRQQTGACRRNANPLAQGPRKVRAHLRRRLPSGRRSAKSRMPLIVTGTIMFTPQQTSACPVNRRVWRPTGPPVGHPTARVSGAQRLHPRT